MKNIYSLVLLLFSASGLFATTYYSQGNVTASSLASWNTNRGGGGSVPSNFTTAGDVFIVQENHSVSSGSWNLGSAAVIIRIESGGQLTATNAITFGGNFEILDGGRYVHNTNVNTTIFSGTENFEDSSFVEIMNWSANDLPSGVQFGNLVFKRTLSTQWNLNGAVTNVSGSLTVLNSGAGSLVLTDNANFNLNIGKSLLVNGGELIIKSGNGNGFFARVQVEKNVEVDGGTLNLGDVDMIGNNELSFKGNLVFKSGAITSLNAFAFMVANGNTAQKLDIAFSNTVNASLKIAPGANVELITDLSFDNQKYFVVAGGLSLSSGRLLSVPEGQIVVPGGTINAQQGYINVVNSNCSVCTGDGQFMGSDWCKNTGTKGTINITQGALNFSTSAASVLNVGQISSPGDLNLIESSVNFTEDPGTLSGTGRIELYPSSSLFIDVNSVITGNAFYNGMGGKLAVGTIDGISTSGESGAIQISGTRNYNSSGDNSFEFRSNISQETGDGIPDEITGNLIINNTAGLEVTLNKAVNIKNPGQLILTKGYLTTIGNNDIRLDNGVTVSGGSANAFVNGRLRRVGNTAFTFPVGKNGFYSPVVMTNKSGQKATDEFSAEYFPANPNALIPGAIVLPPLDLISSVEYWEINSIPVDLKVSKNITLPISSRSGVQNMSSLAAAYYDGTGYWQNYGSTSINGTPSGGTLTFETNFYGYFTLGSLDAQNTLPVRIIDFKAVKNGSSVLLNWKIAGENEAEKYDVLVSSNSRDFVEIGSVKAVSGKADYTYGDNVSRTGTTYYRLKITAKDGKVAYSKVVVLFQDGNGKMLVTIAPTVTSTSSNVFITSPKAGWITLSLSNMNGQLVKARTMFVKEGDNIEKVDMSGAGVGQYILTLTNDKGERQSFRLIKK